VGDKAANTKAKYAKPTRRKKLKLNKPDALEPKYKNKLIL
jgi:hypothetical protein